MSKVLLNFQMSPFDYEQGVELLRLICDLEDKPRHDVLFMLTHRYDMTPDPAVASMVREKFPDLIVYKTERKGTGWPEGPNSMFGDSFMHAVKLAQKGLGIDAIFFMECDCIPLRKSWLSELLAEWKECRAAGKLVLGPWIEKGDGPMRHINGNCILAIELWRNIRGIFHSPSKVGWDAYHAQALLANARPSRLIYSDYRLGTPDNPWRGDKYLWQAKEYKAPTSPLYGEKLQPAYMHGLKTMQGIIAVRKKLLTSV